MAQQSQLLRVVKYITLPDMLKQLAQAEVEGNAAPSVDETRASSPCTR